MGKELIWPFKKKAVAQLNGFANDHVELGVHDAEPVILINGIPVDALYDNEHIKQFLRNNINLWNERINVILYDESNAPIDYGYLTYSPEDDAYDLWLEDAGQIIAPQTAQTQNTLQQGPAGLNLQGATDLPENQNALTDISKYDNAQIDYQLKSKWSPFFKGKREEKRQRASELATNLVRNTSARLENLQEKAKANEKKYEEKALQIKATIQNTIVADAEKIQKRTDDLKIKFREEGTKQKQELLRYYYGSLTVIDVNTEKQKKQLQQSYEDAITILHSDRNTQKTEISLVYKEFKNDIELIIGDYQKTFNEKAQERADIYTSDKKLDDRLGVLKGKAATNMAKEYSIGIKNIGNEQITEKKQELLTISAELDQDVFEGEKGLKNIYEEAVAALNRKALEDKAQALQIKQDNERKVDQFVASKQAELDTELSAYYRSLEQLQKDNYRLIDEAVSTLVKNEYDLVNQTIGTVGQRLDHFVQEENTTKRPKAKKLVEKITTLRSDVNPELSNASNTLNGGVENGLKKIEHVQGVADAALKLATDESTKKINGIEKTDFPKELKKLFEVLKNKQLDKRTQHLRDIIKKNNRTSAKLYKAEEEVFNTVENKLTEARVDNLERLYKLEHRKESIVYDFFVDMDAAERKAANDYEQLVKDLHRRADKIRKASAGAGTYEVMFKNALHGLTEDQLEHLGEIYKKKYGESITSVIFGETKQSGEIDERFYLLELYKSGYIKNVTGTYYKRASITASKDHPIDGDNVSFDLEYQDYHYDSNNPHRVRAKWVVVRYDEWGYPLETVYEEGDWSYPYFSHTFEKAGHYKIAAHVYDNYGDYDEDYEFFYIDYYVHDLGQETKDDAQEAFKGQSNTTGEDVVAFESMLAETRSIAAKYVDKKLYQSWVEAHAEVITYEIVKKKGTASDRKEKLKVLKQKLASFYMHFYNVVVAFDKPPPYNNKRQGVTNRYIKSQTLKWYMQSLFYVHKPSVRSSKTRKPTKEPTNYFNAPVVSSYYNVLKAFDLYLHSKALQHKDELEEEDLEQLDGLVDVSQLAQSVASLYQQYDKVYKVKAVFYPEEYRMVDGKLAPKGNGHQLFMYLYYDRGSWYLHQITGAKQHPINVMEGSANAPFKALFWELDSKLRFPKGVVQYEIEGFQPNFVRTHAYETWSDWLGKWGFFIVLAGLVATIVFPPAASVLIYSGTALSAASTIMDMVEKDQHNLLKPGEVAIGVTSIIADFATLGAGSFKAIAKGSKFLSAFPQFAGKGQVLLRLSEKSMKVGKSLTKLAVGAELLSFAMFSLDTLKKFNEINNSTMPDDERDIARQRLLTHLFIAGGLTFISIPGYKKDLKGDGGGGTQFDNWMWKQGIDMDDIERQIRANKKKIENAQKKKEQAWDDFHNERKGNKVVGAGNTAAYTGAEYVFLGKAVHKVVKMGWALAKVGKANLDELITLLKAEQHINKLSKNIDLDNLPRSQREALEKILTDAKRQYRAMRKTRGKKLPQFVKDMTKSQKLVEGDLLTKGVHVTVNVGNIPIELSARPTKAGKVRFESAFPGQDTTNRAYKEAMKQAEEAIMYKDFRNWLLKHADAGKVYASGYPLNSSKRKRLNEFEELINVLNDMEL